MVDGDEEKTEEAASPTFISVILSTITCSSCPIAALSGIRLAMIS